MSRVRLGRRWSYVTVFMLVLWIVLVLLRAVTLVYDVQALVVWAGVPDQHEVDRAWGRIALDVGWLVAGGLFIRLALRDLRDHWERRDG